jgi:hypothetical protein
MNRLAHTFFLAIFGIACWFLWGVLTLASNAGRHAILPGFTTFCCIALRPLMIVLPILATAYCVWIWLRRTDRTPSWVAFFAVTTGVLILVTLPTLVAAYLPLVDYYANR